MNKGYLLVVDKTVHLLQAGPTLLSISQLA